MFNSQYKYAFTTIILNVDMIFPWEQSETKSKFIYETQLLWWENKNINYVNYVVNAECLNPGIIDLGF